MVPVTYTIRTLTRLHRCAQNFFAGDASIFFKIAQFLTPFITRFINYT